MQPGARGAGAGGEREDRDVAGGADRVGEPQQPLRAVLARVGEHALGEVQRIRPAAALRVHEPGHLHARVHVDAGVVVHVQDPHVGAGLALPDAHLVRVVVGPGLEPGAARGAVGTGHDDDADPRPGQPADPLVRLAALLDDDVHAHPGEVHREGVDVGAHHALQRRVRREPADGRHDDEQHRVVDGRRRLCRAGGPQPAHRPQRTGDPDERGRGREGPQHGRDPAQGARGTPLVVPDPPGDTQRHQERHHEGRAPRTDRADGSLRQRDGRGGLVEQDVERGRQGAGAHVDESSPGTGVVARHGLSIVSGTDARYPVAARTTSRWGQASLTRWQGLVARPASDHPRESWFS